MVKRIAASKSASRTGVDSAKRLGDEVLHTNSASAIVKDSAQAFLFADYLSYVMAVKQ